jgi:hypothetical protein
MTKDSPLQLNLFDERDLCRIKADDLDLRPMYHRLEAQSPRPDLHARVLPHLATATHLDAAGLNQRRSRPRASLSHTHSALSRRPGHGQRGQDGWLYRSFHDLIADLPTLSRNQVRFAGIRATTTVLTEPISESVRPSTSLAPPSRSV